MSPPQKPLPCPAFMLPSNTIHPQYWYRSLVRVYLNRICNATSPYTSIPYLLNEDHNPYFVGFPDGTVGKESACQSRRHKRHRFDPWVRKILWHMKWQPTPEFLPSKSHGQKSLVGCSRRGRKELDMTERTHACTTQRGAVLSRVNTPLGPGAFTHQKVGLF